MAATDGGFAGNFGADATQNPWGTVTFRFSDLDHMTVDYAADAGLPVGIPAGTGTLQFQRLLDIAGLCRPPMICIQ
ncbi:MAG TPA: hypothetical protein VFG55_00405 [Rhodanobacteraceae bacterium]|nr:hypothetical protein [Rhodanobacteraceae bacterium]